MFTKEQLKLWDDRKINEIQQELGDDCMGFGATYFPDLDVTCYYDIIFEGYYYDDNIEVVKELKKGRSTSKELFDYFSDI